ncbi:MAG: AAA family ATPase [Ilumatobacteraceae bacterium]
MLGLGTILVERVHQLDELCEVMRASAGAVALIEGEAGAGKTALMAEARRVLPDHVQVWSSRCEALAVPAPYSALYETLDRMPVELRDVVRRGESGVAAFAAVLDELRRKPTVLLIDDLQWADTATAGLVRYLARRIHDVPSAIVAAYRADDLPGNRDAGDLVVELGRHGRRIALPPLTVDGVAELAAELAPDRVGDAEAIRRLTGGNPLFVVEVLRQENPGAVPGSVADIVTAGLRRLPLAAQRVVEAISLCAEGIDVESAAALSVDAGVHVDLACERRLLVFEDGRVRCRHELIRSAVDSSVPPVRRRQLHRDIVGAVGGRARTARDVAMLAHHSAAGGLARRAVEYSLAAAQTAISARAHREAADHFAQALRFREEMDPVELDVTMARAVPELMLSGRFDHAETLAQQRLDLAPDDEIRAAALLQLADVASQRGQCSRSSELIRASVALAPAPSPLIEVERITDLAVVAYRAGRLDEATETYATALDVARTTDDAGLVARASARLAGVRVAAGDRDGIAMFHSAIAAALRAGADDHAAFAHNNLAAGLVWWFDVPAAILAVERGLEFTLALQLDTWRTSMQGSGAVAAAYACDWNAVERYLLFDPAMSSCHGADAEALAVAAAVRLRRGLPEDGSVSAALHAADVEPEPLYYTRVYATELALEAAWIGVHSRADALDRLDTQLTSSWMIHDPWARTRLGFWALRLTGEVVVDDVAGPFAAELAGDHASAAEGWDALGCPVHAAVTLAAMPEPPVDDIVNRLQSVDAAGVLAATQRDWRRRGVSSRSRAASTHPSGLSARQLDVLWLLAAGRTNGEIATELFISEKTAEHHVSAILTRLGVPTRRAAVGHALERGWVTR